MNYHGLPKSRFRCMYLTMLIKIGGKVIGLLILAPYLWEMSKRKSHRGGSRLSDLGLQQLTMWISWTNVSRIVQMKFSIAATACM